MKKKIECGYNYHFFIRMKAENGQKQPCECDGQCCAKRKEKCLHTNGYEKADKSIDEIEIIPFSVGFIR